MARWLREHGLLLVNAGLFFAFLVGMTLTGWHVASDEAVRHGEGAESFAAYVNSGDFYEAAQFHAVQGTGEVHVLGVQCAGDFGCRAVAIDECDEFPIARIDRH